MKLYHVTVKARILLNDQPHTGVFEAESATELLDTLQRVFGKIQADVLEQLPLSTTTSANSQQLLQAQSLRSAQLRLLYDVTHNAELLPQLTRYERVQYNLLRQWLQPL